MALTDPKKTILTPDQRLRVFISSTIQELAPEREAVRRAISRLRLVPVYFESGARPHPAQDLYRSYLAQSHIFLGIYWQSYGWVAPGDSISGLEDEYRLSQGLPRLIYIKQPAPERQDRLKEMLALVKSDGAVSYKSFQTPDELAELVENDLALLLTERFAASAAALPAGLAPEALEARPPVPPARPAWQSELSHFIGREDQLEAIAALLRQEHVRLVTLTGPGGVGKTRLARKTAAALADEFPDGVYFIDLAPVFDPDLVLNRIAVELGLREAFASSLTDMLSNHLADRRVLLVLDNFEQILPAAPQIGALLAAAPRVKALVTSRSVLRVRGEYEHRVPPMRLPESSDQAAERVSRCEAVRLFVERASARQPLFLTDENAPLVAEICRRLDGLPLALELAAGRIGMLTLPMLLDRLSERLKILSGPRDLPDRQRTLWNTIEWSYGLLSREEQVLFARLSVFQGPWTLAAVERICADESTDDVFWLLESLLDKNLIYRMSDLNGETRFGMLQTLREFAEEKLAESGEASAVRARHAEYYLHHINETFRQRFIQPELWPVIMENMIDNARGAIAWAIQSRETFSLAGHIALNLFFFWYARGLLNEGYTTLQRLIDRHPPDAPGLHAALLKNCGMFACWVGQYQASRTYLDESLRLLRGLGSRQDLDPHQGLDSRQGRDSRQDLGEALMFRGVLAIQEGDEEGALPVLEESLEIFKETGDKMFQSVAQMHLANAVMGWFDLPRAEQYLAAGAENARQAGGETGEVWVLAMITHNQGEAARMQGRYARAGEAYLESMVQFRRIDARGDLNRVLHCLGYVSLEAGDIAAARARFCESLVEFHKLNLRRGVSECVAGLARVLALEGSLEQAAWLLGYAQASLDALSLRWWPADRIEVNKTRRLLAEGLGEPALEAGLARGRSLSQEAALDLALNAKTRS